MTSPYSKMTKEDGTPADQFFGAGTTLESDEEVIGALRQCYGMIWWLAEMLCAGHSGRINPPKGCHLV